MDSKARLPHTIKESDGRAVNSNAEAARKIVWRENERGSALIITIMILALLSVFVALALSRTTNETMIMGNDKAAAKSFYAAQASLETMTNSFNKTFDIRLRPIQADFDRVANTKPFGFADKFDFSHQTIQQTGDSEIKTIQSAPFAGLRGFRDRWTLTTTTTGLDGNGAEVMLTRKFDNYRVPLFQFNQFSEFDIYEVQGGTRHQFDGPIHTNKNIYMATSNAGGYYKGKISAAGEVVTGGYTGEVFSNDGQYGNGRIYIKNPKTKQYVPLFYGNQNDQSQAGSAILGSNDKNPQWAASRARFDGAVEARVKELAQPLKKTGASPTEMIKPGQPNDKIIVAASRYYNKPGLRVSLGDSQSELPGGSGIRLDGAASGDGADAPVNQARGYQPCPGCVRINGNRLYHGLDQNGHARQSWIKIEMVHVSEEDPSNPVTDDVTKEVLSYGVTENGPLGLGDPNAILNLQRFEMPGSPIRTAFDGSNTEDPTLILNDQNEKWVKLVVDAADLGLAGNQIQGFAVTAWGGHLYWGNAGVVSHDASGNIVVTKFVNDGSVQLNGQLAPSYHQAINASYNGAADYLQEPFAFQQPTGQSSCSDDTCPGARMNELHDYFENSNSITGVVQRFPFSTVHQMYFYNATNPVAINAGDKLFVWVRVDPKNVPSELMLQFQRTSDSDWARATWGKDLINWQPALKRFPDLPAELANKKAFTYTRFNGSNFCNSTANGPNGSNVYYCTEPYYKTPYEGINYVNAATDYLLPGEAGLAKTLTANTLGVSAGTALVPFPIKFFSPNDIPDPLVTELDYANTVPWSGVFNSIDFDVANFRKFVNGDLGVGSNAFTPDNFKNLNDEGYLVYVSDRRGDYVNNDGKKDGIYQWYQRDESDARSPAGAYRSTSADDKSCLDASDAAKCDAWREAALWESNAFKETRFDTGTPPGTATLNWGRSTDPQKDIVEQGLTTNTPGYFATTYSDLAALFNYKSFRNVVRLIHGKQLPGDCQLQSDGKYKCKGFTFASENGIFVYGNYNSTGLTRTSDGHVWSDKSWDGWYYNGLFWEQGDYAGELDTEFNSDYMQPSQPEINVPSSVMGDYSSPLSNDWLDSKSFRFPVFSQFSQCYSVDHLDNYINPRVNYTAQLTARYGRLWDYSYGDYTFPTSNASPDCAPTWSKSSGQYNGKYIRRAVIQRMARGVDGPVLEEACGYDWSSIRYNLYPYVTSGSRVILFQSVQNAARGYGFTPINQLGPGWPYENAFEKSFEDLNRLPPATPFAQYIQLTSFRQND